MKRSRSENQEALAGVVAAIVGLFLVSNAPADQRPLAILVVIVVYFIAFLVVARVRARRARNRSSR